jgi:soluble lytic murein transglycosylase-like protein
MAGSQSQAFSKNWITPTIKKAVERESRRHGIPTRIIYNLIHAESSGKVHVKGKLFKLRVNGRLIKTRAWGAMQIIPELHYKGNPEDLLKYPSLNIRIGCRIFKNCIKRAKGDYVQALKYYNGQVHNLDYKYINKILGGKHGSRKNYSRL